MATEGEFLTVSEVATLLKLNQQTVRNWIDQGKLSAIRVGRRVRIRRTELEGMIARGSTPRPTPGAAGADPSAQGFWDGTLIPSPAP